MASDLTKEATRDNNAFERYYQRQDEYRDNIGLLKSATERKAEREAELGKAEKELTSHKALHDSFVKESYNELMEELKSGIRDKYNKLMTEVETAIAGCENEISRTRQRLIAPDSLFWEIGTKRKREQQILYKYAYKAEEDMANFYKCLSNKTVERILGGARDGLEDTLSYEMIGDIANECPRDYKARNKKGKVGDAVTAVVMRLLTPPFIYEESKPKRPHAFIYWGILSALLLGLLIAFIVTGLVLAVVETVLILLILVLVVVPRQLAERRLRRAASFYVLINEREAWLQKLARAEANESLADVKGEIEAIVAKIKGQIEEYRSQKTALAAELESAIAGIDTEAIKRDAEKKFEEETARRQGTVDKAKQKIAEVEKEIAELEETNQDFLNLSKNFLNPIKTDFKCENTDGRLWDAIYFFGITDEVGFTVLSKLEHDLQPQVLLYDCDSKTPANDPEMLKLIQIIISNIARSHGTDWENLVKFYVVDTVGGATIYKQYSSLLTPIGSQEEIRSKLEKEVTALANNLSGTSIVEKNSAMIRDGRLPLNHIIAFIFVPQGNASANYNILGEELVRMIRQNGRFGFLPFFFIHQEDWWAQSADNMKQIELIEELLGDSNGRVWTVNYRERSLAAV
jgi:hypothetical protein